MYEQGRGVPQDGAEAAHWYAAAAEQGLLPAEWNLAVAYEKGHGIPQDYKQARYWYEQGAHAGDKQSEERLGAIGALWGPLIDGLAAARRLTLCWDSASPA
jgi:TPR repeat protein